MDGGRQDFSRSGFQLSNGTRTERPGAEGHEGEDTATGGRDRTGKRTSDRDKRTIFGVDCKQSLSDPRH